MVDKRYTEELKAEKRNEIGRLRLDVTRAREERDALARELGRLRVGKAKRFRFIRDNQSQFDIAALCRVLGVARSGYYAWPERPESRHAKEDRRLLAETKAIHEESGGAYGSPRVLQALRDRGIKCGRNRVTRLMRKNALVACRKHK